MAGRDALDGAQIRLRGETVHLPCSDGVSPCRFVGYRFRNGDVRYFVGVDGWLRVTDGRGRILLNEQGVWAD